MPYAVITGGTQGIGRAVAEKLLSQGFSVAICGRNKLLLQQLHGEWSARYPSEKIVTYTADVSVPEQVAEFAAAVQASFPVVDILVNNAGTFRPGALASEPAGMLEYLMGVNLYSAYHLTRELLPGMIHQRQGHIFNMCSVASLRAYPNGGAYSITKYALLGFSDNLREELKQYNIRVTALCPGATYTASWAGSGVDPERIMEAADVAEMLWSAWHLSARANVDTIVMRPQQGDL